MKIKRRLNFKIFMGIGCVLIAVKFVEARTVLYLDQELSMSGANIEERIAELDLPKFVDMPRKHHCKQFTRWGIYKYQTCFYGSYVEQEELASKFSDKRIPHIFSYRYTPPRPFLSFSRIIGGKTYFHGGRPFERSYGRIFADGTWDILVRDKYLNSYFGIKPTNFPSPGLSPSVKTVKIGEWK